MYKKVTFDQDCGCYSFFDVSGRTVESYNVYGSINKYNTSGINKGLDVSPYHRRKFLEEHGFSRACGRKVQVSDIAAKVFDCIHHGYKMIEVPVVAKKDRVEVPVLQEA